MLAYHTFLLKPHYDYSYCSSIIGGGGATTQYGGPASSYDGTLETIGWSGGDGTSAVGNVGNGFAYTTTASNKARGGGGSLTAGGANSPSTCGATPASSQYHGADGTAAVACCGGGGNSVCLYDYSDVCSDSYLYPLLTFRFGRWILWRR